MTSSDRQLRKQVVITSRIFRQYLGSLTCQSFVLMQRCTGLLLFSKQVRKTTFYRIFEFRIQEYRIQEYRRQEVYAQIQCRR